MSDDPHLGHDALVNVGCGALWTGVLGCVVSGLLVALGVATLALDIRLEARHWKTH